MVLIFNYYAANKWCLITHFVESQCILEKRVVGSAMRTYVMNDAQDPYERREYVMGEMLELEMLRQILMGGGFNILPWIL